jgi:predicted nucleic acid-binding protein
VRVFVDTGALLALSHARDQNHRLARRLAEGHAASGCQYVSSTLVLGEFHSHLMYLRGPAPAAHILGLLLDDPQHDWLEVASDTVHEARSSWLLRFADQDFSLTDAVSFEIMKREKLTHAFAFDRHFEVAGFSLLR